jgi:mannose-6-phosphate isomerase-like protein (cupin superfamily)
MAGQGEEETTQGVLGPGEGHQLTARGSVMAFKAVAAQTGGDFSLMERTLPPGGRRPPAHRHVNCSEAFFVLEGRVGFELDGRELTGGPGDFLLVPRGAAHTFGNAAGAGGADGAGGDGETARLLVLHAPAMDGYFEELHRLWASGEPPSREEERALMARYGMEPPGAPGSGG